MSLQFEEIVFSLRRNVEILELLLQMQVNHSNVGEHNAEKLDPHTCFYLFHPQTGEITLNERQNVDLCLAHDLELIQ